MPYKEPHCRICGKKVERFGQFCKKCNDYYKHYIYFSGKKEMEMIKNEFNR